jgi:hypothetical protein
MDLLLRFLCRVGNRPIGMSDQCRSDGEEDQQRRRITCLEPEHDREAGEELDDGGNPGPGYRRTGHAVREQIRCKAADARAVDASELAEAARQVEGTNR